MPEYVYALHDFTPENSDEISFRAGDRIEVIEKDDLYGDGWWQGRNLFGKVGLFPQSFTTSDPTVFQPNGTPQPVTATNSQTSLNSPLQTLQEDENDSTGVMRATLTDVQEAIEQLGRKDHDGGGSFSFASTRDGDTTDRELTDRETDAENDVNGDNAWHKGARHNLAEKARAAQAADSEVGGEAPPPAAAEATPPTPTASTIRTFQPPIEVELSDESEGEDDDESHAVNTHTQFPRREHADISEEEDDEPARRASAPVAVNPQPPQSDTVEVPNEVDKPIGTARPTTFSRSETASPRPVSPLVNHTFPSTPPITPSVASIPQPQARIDFPSAIPRPTSQPELKATMILPSPPSSSNGTTKEGPNFANTHPSEWTVDDVVEWAKSKQFDKSVCDKFIEHEITGDVLLDLDVNLLKSELEITAFGKRMRIANAIAELKRPASAVSSDLLQQPHHQRQVSQSVSLPNSANLSLHSPLAAWQNGYGSVRGDGASTINGSGAHSPSAYTFAQAGHTPHSAELSVGHGARQFRQGSEPASSVRMSMIDNSEQITTSTTAASSATGFGAAGNGFDGGYRGQPKGRPGQLALSPSINSLRASAKSPRFAGADNETAKDDRTVLSDTESAHAMDERSKRRRLFGRSTASADSKESNRRQSKEMHTPISSHPGSPAAKSGSFDDSGPGKGTRRKRSVDASKPADRLSIFGTSFPSLGKTRKPAPRLSSNGSSYAHDDTAIEKSSRGLSRLYMGSGSHGKKNRPVTAIVESPSGSTIADRDVRESAVLRKRTASHYEAPPLADSTSSLKPGQSVLEQIGDPDFTGWMRKKGEHYNTWKLRYFVLKGPHLYYLRSDRGTETKIKGYINIVGYKVHVDENVNPGKYGFRLTHDAEKTHYFCSEEQATIREWMKALMKATIGRDYTKPVISSCNIPTIPLAVAQTMNPAPRPPSPTQRAATQKALRRENPNQLSSRDARILMGLPSGQNGIIDGVDERVHEEQQYYAYDATPNADQTGPAPPMQSQIPPRPAREARRTSVSQTAADDSNAEIIRWANEFLPESLRVPETGGQVYSGLALYRLAEAIKGKPTEPPVPDNAFPAGPNDDRLDGLFKLFDFFLNNDIRMGNVSINDVKQGRKDKIIQLVRSLRAWEEKRKNIARSIGRSGAHVGPFMTLEA